jgi:hypothetical protein
VLLAAEGAPVRGSVYVPVDSWVYLALHRLAALGYITRQIAGVAPWTRAECLRQTQEAETRVEYEEARYVQRPGDVDVRQLIADLKAEFSEEDRNSDFRLASIYTRALGIGGTPLRDSYHFGQTLADDYGRPYSSGFNNVTGFSAFGHTGRFSAFVRGEYESAGGSSGYSPAVQQFIATVDGVPPQPSAVAKTSRFQTLEMYVGAQFGPENITFGKQALWWGPGEDSAFTFSNNAAPYYMLRFDQSKALVLPGVLRHLGKIHTQILFGELAGHHWPAHPYINAQKITLDLTDNFELGFTRSAIFGGVGHPLTLDSFWQSLVSVKSVDYGPYGSPDLPGNRHSGFDARWRLPRLRFVTIYVDSFGEDEPSPIDSPRRAAWAPGIYLARLPKLSRMDLRFENYATWLYAKDHGGSFFYWDNQYRDAYTNEGNLLGSWVGRDARAYVATTRYWLSGATYLQAQYRQIKTGEKFLPGGGTQTDVSLSGQIRLNREWMVGALLQGERYDIPVLGAARLNAAASLEVTFTPANWAIGR